MKTFHSPGLHPLIAVAIVCVLVSSMAALVSLFMMSPSPIRTAVVGRSHGGTRVASGPIAANLQRAPELSGDTAAGTSASGMPLAVPAVYIHVQSRAMQEQMRMLGPTLAGHGLRLAGIKIVERGPERSDLRYFRDGERGEAAAVQRVLLELGLPVSRLKKIAGFEPVAIPRQYEVWLAADYQPSH